jgi:hypothetical protein
LFSDHILAGLAGSTALKDTGLLLRERLSQGVGGCFQPTELEVFKIIFWRAFSGSAALKIPVLLSTEPRREFFSDHILASILGSAALKVPVLLSQARGWSFRQGWRLFFRSFLFGRHLRALPKEPVLLSTEPRGWRLFSDHILAGLFGLCSIKDTGPISNQLG